MVKEKLKYLRDFAKSLRSGWGRGGGGHQQIQSAK